ncbi:MAG: flagellin [Planctomycetota bacterium]|nr:flagellin [Planctomycetota bacterium]
MSRINTNVSSLIAQRVLNFNNGSLNLSLERLSTGLRINRGKDDPAGLIASQNLRAEKGAVGQAITNAERADQVVNIAEGGLTEISDLLSELQSLITQTANAGGISVEEKQANQLQIDSILQTIDRVAAATSFQGLKLLNGNLDYTTDNISTNIATFKVNGAKVNHDNTLDVDVVVTGSAQVAGFYLSFGDANLDLTDADSRFVLEIAGSRGARELSFVSGTSIADIVAAVNSFTEVTGVVATLSGSSGTTSGIVLQSAKFGSDEFVTVRVVGAGGINSAVAQAGIYEFQAANTNLASTAGADRTLFNAASVKITDRGQDVSATINGIPATTQGTVARINTDFLDVEVDLRTGTASSTGAEAQRLGALSAFRITGGGADFQLAGRVDIAGKVSIGIPNFSVRNVGRSTINTASGAETFFLSDLSAGRSLSVVDGDLSAAQDVVAQAIKDVTSLRGRLGAFQKNTIGATIRSLGVSLENTSAAESIIRDTDFANETSALTRSQVLLSSSTQILTIANSAPQSALQLLG